MVSSIDLNADCRFVNTFSSVTLTQQLFDFGIFDLYQLLKISSTCKTLRISFVSYKNWQLRLIKGFLYRRALDQSSRSFSYLDGISGIYMTEHGKIDVLHMAITLAAASVLAFLDTDSEDQEDLIKRYKKILQRQQSRSFRCVDDVFALVNLFPDDGKRSRTLAQICVKILETEDPDSLRLAFIMSSEYEPAFINANHPLSHIIVKQANQNEPDAIENALQTINEAREEYLAERGVDACLARHDHLFHVVALICAQLNNWDKAIEIAHLINNIERRHKTICEIAVACAEHDSVDSITRSFEILQKETTIQPLVLEKARNNIVIARAKKSDTESIKVALSMIDISDRTHSLILPLACICIKKGGPNSIEEALALVNEIRSQIMPNNGIDYYIIEEIILERARQPDENAIEESMSATAKYLMTDRIPVITSRIAAERAKKTDPLAISTSLAIVKSIRIDNFGKYTVLKDIAQARFYKGDPNALKAAIEIISLGSIRNFPFSLCAFAEKCNISQLPVVADPIDIMRTLYGIVNPIRRSCTDPINFTEFDVQMPAMVEQRNVTKRRKTPEIVGRARSESPT